MSILLSFLRLIPPELHPHMHNTIAIPFDALAKLVIRSSQKLRKGVNKAREAKQRGDRQNERVEGVVERRKRKAQEEDVELGTQNTEEQEEACEAAWVTVRERQKLRA
ncbi:hypothetical protein EV426DRAFT_706472 [Tirmania nivea]|nr:hypothetical protein EV426DRAFT_706472 [Tirmania nivea]